MLNVETQSLSPVPAPVSLGPVRVQVCVYACALGGVHCVSSCAKDRGCKVEREKGKLKGAFDYDSCAFSFNPRQGHTDR